MSLSRIGYNIHAQRVRDTAALLAHLRRLRPAWSLVMDNIDMAHQVHQAAGGNVIYREWPDDDAHLRRSPEQFVAHMQTKIGSSGLWAYTNNESGFGDDLLNWLLEVIARAAQKGLRVCVLNTSVGTPQPEDWRKPAAVRLLRALDKYRDTAVLGLHEYAGAVVTSGFVGGNPTYIQPATWPKQDARALTKWHMGRFNFMLQACIAEGITPPRVVITEHGFDDLNDIGGWLNALQRTPGYPNIRGWKSLKEQWRQWWPQWAHDVAYFEQLAYANEHIYAGTPVEAQLIFSYGDSGGWEQFDVEGARDLQGLLEVYAAAPAPPGPAPIPTPEPLPDDDTELLCVTRAELQTILDAFAADIKAWVTTHHLTKAETLRAIDSAVDALPARLMIDVRPRINDITRIPKAG